MNPPLRRLDSVRLRALCSCRGSRGVPEDHAEEGEGDSARWDDSSVSGRSKRRKEGVVLSFVGAFGVDA
jgi:hypothetical protein